MRSTIALFTLGLCVLALMASSSAQEPAAIRRVARPVQGRYIVVLRGADDPEAVGVETAGLRNGLLRHVYRDALRGFAIQLPEPAALALASDPRVAYVEEDGVASVMTVQSGATWGLDRIDQRNLPLNGEYGYSRSGYGVNVHVVDTGIRATHSEFGGRAFLAGDYVDDDNDGDPSDVNNDDGNPSLPDGADCHGHGTHVAGTIGGSTYGVAKNVTLWAYRVLDCTGNGLWSSVIAAVDAITADVVRRPAVVNMSLGGSPSSALESAIRTSIGAGVTYVVAAGNSNADASYSSPARVVEAITVGATSSTDVRAGFSNFGPVLDLFAPGVSIQSATISSDIATATLSGTSMAAPHVAGVAALHLEENASASPEAVRSSIVAAATPGLVTDAGPGSPNLLLYSPTTAPTPVVVTMVTPNGSEKLFTGTPYVLRWAATGADASVSFDVQVSTDDGDTYNDIAGCTGLDDGVRQCTWSAPGPATGTARVRVVARGTFGELVADASDGPFTIASGSAAVTVRAPNTVANWGRGSRQAVTWKHNLGANSYMRLEVSYDAGATFSVIAPAVRNTASTSGQFEWTVSGPDTTSALIRVSWTGGPAADTSNALFTISDPYISVTRPATRTEWGYGTQRVQSWQTNLGPGDRVDILLSVNGAGTFPIVVASDVAARPESIDFRVPVLAAPTTAARIQVRWANAPSGFGIAANSPVNFSIAPPFVRMTSPNGGDTWVSGTPAVIRWQHNLGPREDVALELSLDGGGSYDAAISFSTPSDGRQTLIVSPEWITPAGRVRVRWVSNATVVDASDATLQIVSSP